MPTWSVEILAVVDELLPQAAAQLFEEVRREIPAYAGELEDELTRLAETGVERALGHFADRLRDPERPDDPSWRSVIAELGRSAQRAGRSLENVLAAYRVGARLAWREIAQAGSAAGIAPEELYRLAEELFIYVDQLSSISAEAFAAAQAEAAGERQRRRRMLAALLLADSPPDPGAVADAARQAAWSLPRELAAVAADTAEPERLAGRIGPDVLAGVGRDPSLLLVPDPMAPGRVTAIRAAAAAEGVRAALGPTVTVEDARASADRALRALALARDGVLPGEGLVVSDEHLLALLVHRDERLLADLATQALRPMNELSPRSRERLLETLAAFLDHEGRMDPTAHALGVHPQTVRYRVAQLRELLGRALDEPDGRLALLLALRNQPGPGEPRSGVTT